MKISRMKFIAAITATVAMLLACNGAPNKDTPDLVKDTTESSDTIPFPKDTATVLFRRDSLSSGAYQGIFPCPDCDGIQQTILFNTDKTYKQEQVLWGKNELSKMHEGVWKIRNGRIELMQNSKVALTMIKEKDTLFVVSINGIELNNSSKYFLTRRSMARDNPVWVKKQKAGIDFAGMGNEPFWNLEIDKQKYISFKLADWKKPVRVAAEKPVIIKDSTIYYLKKDTLKWMIKIFPQFCGDGMTDYLYQYKVNVDYKGVMYKGCGIALSKLNSQ